MKVQIEGQGALVTGASSGIGREISKELAKHGARLALVARRTALLEQLAEEIVADGGHQPVVIAADLAQPGAAAEVAAHAAAALGVVDILVNNAGINAGGLQWSTGDGAAVRESFEVDVFTPLALVSALVPPMRQQRRGAVVNITSMSQLMAWPALGNLSVTKAALAMATQTLGMELRRSGVHVLEVNPGPIDTAVQAEAQLVPGFDRALARMPMGNPEVLARRTVKALQRGRSRLVYPRLMLIPYLLPGVARWYAAKLAKRLDPAFSDDTRVLRSGSMGDAELRSAREAWERARGLTAPRRATSSSA